jgi:hypothetical protein
MIFSARVKGGQLPLKIAVIAIFMLGGALQGHAAWREKANFHVVSFS